MNAEERAPWEANIVWTGVVAVLAVAGIVTVAATRLMLAFDSGGVAWEVPLSRDTGSPPLGAPVQVTQGIVTVPDAGGGLSALIIGTVAVASVAGIAAIGCYFVLAVEISRGRTFSVRSIRLLTAMATIVLLGTTTCYLLDSAIGRSLRTAADLGETGSSTPLSYWMGFAIFAGLTLIAYAFRRGSALQKETEGLV
ncbi:hypothetical protein M2317_001131 [Microbacterium sp. ZKA21]|uniref:hypothetical protein n=1 Tax=Microbacterium sp. ZKA21 TaxID=3381694 RepID=UPI003D1D78FD